MRARGVVHDGQLEVSRVPLALWVVHTAFIDIHTGAPVSFLAHVWPA